MSKFSDNLFSIREAAHACGIGRTTLQRLTDDDLIKPAFIGENKYHYYNSKNIYDINLIQLMHECGFTKKQLKSLDMSPETMLAFADELQDKINMLTFNMENLRAASLPEAESMIRIITIPELLCYTTDTRIGYSIREMSSFVEAALSDAVKNGFETNRYYPPFLIPYVEDFLYLDPSGKEYRCKICIPVSNKSKHPELETIPSIKALSVTYLFKEEGNRKYYQMLIDELNELGLKPSGNPRFEALFNPFNYGHDSMNRVALRLSVPV